MAKGDIITGRIAAAGAFQPAVGVEIIITTLTNVVNVASYWGLRVGADSDLSVCIPVMSTAYNPPTVHKIGITNEGYLRTAAGGSYSGVQVK